MKPVYQTRTGMEGNCFAASIASLFELPLEDVPDWRDTPGWYADFHNWILKRYNLYPMILDAPTVKPPWGPYYLVWGKSPRGLEHTCVGRNDQIVHDPHPDGDGIEAEQYVVFVAMLKDGAT